MSTQTACVPAGFFPQHHVSPPHPLPAIPTFPSPLELVTGRAMVKSRPLEVQLCQEIPSMLSRKAQEQEQHYTASQKDQMITRLETEHLSV